VVADDGGILWVVNERPDQRAAITPTTRRVLLLEYTDSETPTTPEFF